MEPKLRDFLKAREAVTEISLAEMITEKIDMEAIVNMTYDQLQKYIPKTGDQIAVTNFCRRNHFVTPNCSTKTLSLIEKLKRGNIEDESASSKDQNASVATRKATAGRPTQDSRKIKLGWIMNGKHVREIRGGGSRTISVKKDTYKQEILKYAVDLFFTKGLSTFGTLENFTYDLLDFKEHAISEELTIGKMYNITKLNTLRFYLATNGPETLQRNTKSKQCSSDDDYSPIKKRKTRGHAVQNRDNTCTNASTSKSAEETVKEDLNEFVTFSSNNLSQCSLDSELHYLNCELLQSDKSDKEYTDNLSETNQLLEIQDNLDIDKFLFENDIERAIRNSLLTNQTISNSADDTNETIANCTNTTTEVSLEGILRTLNSNINFENISQFNIYREDIFMCCIRGLRRKKFSTFNKISVKFSDLEGTSEGAVDQGGPTREMFRLVLHYIKNSRMFFGEEKKYITLDGEALQNQEYFEAGRLIALSLIHGGPGPHFFSKSLFHLLVSGFSQEYISQDNIDYEIRQKLIKVNSFTEFQPLQRYVEEEPIFSIAGWQVLTKIDDKDAMFADVLKFYAYDRIRPALKQLQNGLKEGNLLQIMKQNSNLFQGIMCDDKVPVTANALEKLYTIIYSENGSSNRRLESRCITFWRELLLSCEDGDCDISLEDILVFSTGADCVPPLGFEHKPTITFQKDTLYATANTCGLELRLPMMHQKFEDFKSHVTFGIANCKDFAFA